MMNSGLGSSSISSAVVGAGGAVGFVSGLGVGATVFRMTDVHAKGREGPLFVSESSPDDSLVLELFALVPPGDFSDASAAFFAWTGVTTIDRRKRSKESAPAGKRTI